tara:strand:- start:721 stop:2517 length:1797 start_codon:yes stop_codon:yes gene_type:complete
MAALGSQTIASSYEQLLHVDTDGGGNGASLVSVKDGDNGTTFCISMTDASTGKAVLAVDGSHANGTEIQIDNSATDGDAFLSFQLSGTSKFTMGVDDGDSDKFKIGTTAIGTGTMVALDTNSKVSLSNNDSGTSNTVFGKNAGTNIDAGSNYNIFIGENVSNATMNDATNNIGIGYNDLTNLTSGDNNTVLGSQAGVQLTTGSNNTIMGVSAGDAMTVGANNTVIGKDALIVETVGNHSVAIGHSALNKQTMATHGDNTVSGNTAVGGYAGYYNVTGQNNTFLGYEAGFGSGVGNSHSNNVMIGHQAGYYITDGANNTLVGSQAGVDLTGGSGNVYIGHEAATNASQAGQNVVIGFQAAHGNDSTAWTGDYNVIIGHDAGKGLEGNSSNHNTVVGFEAGKAMTSGAENALFGSKCGDSITSGNNNTLIGYNNDVAAADRNDTICIGKDITSAANSHARLGNGTNFTELNFSASGNSWANTSDIRIKKDIVDGDLGLDFVNKLRTIKYKDKPSSEWSDELKSGMKSEAITTESSNAVQDGFVAQEVKKIADDLGTTFSGWQGDESDTSQRQMLQYDKFVVPLIKAVQELSAKVKALENA